MFIHDIIKIKYINEGYLPNYPYHLVSDVEMFDAFFGEDGYLTTNYPCPSDDLTDAYDVLAGALHHHINNYIATKQAIPKWVYSYMLGNTLSIYSDERDIDDLITLLNLEVDVDNSEFTEALSKECYKISSAWLRKLPADKLDHRPPTMFGEPHVIKSLRLKAVDSSL